jgi:WD40 repeat protein
VTHAAFAPDGKRLAVATAEGTALLWDVAGGPATAPLLHGQPLRLVGFSGDGRRLVTIADDRTARVWDVVSGQPVTPMLSHAQPIIEAVLSPDGRRLVTCGENGTARVWDLTGDDRPVADLLELTRLLSGLALDRKSGGLVPVEMADLRTAWPQMRAKYRHEFTPTPPESHAGDASPSLP